MHVLVIRAYFIINTIGLYAPVGVTDIGLTSAEVYRRDTSSWPAKFSSDYNRVQNDDGSFCAAVQRPQKVGQSENVTKISWQGVPGVCKWRHL